MSTSKKALIISVAASFSLSVLFTIFQQQFLIELFAPITNLLVFFLLTSNLKDLGPHKFSTACMAFGFLSLVIGDTIRFTNHFLMHAEPYSDVTRFIYVLPNLFFAMNTTSFLLNKLSGRKRDISNMFVNTFSFSIIGFVFLYKFFRATAGNVRTFIQFSYLVFIFIAFYVIMMSLQIFYFVGRVYIRRETLLTTTAMTLYECLDIQYIFTEAIGKVPDNNYVDLVYSFLIIVMTAGLTYQVQKKYVFNFRKLEYTIRSITLKLFYGIIGIVVTILLLLLQMLTRTEASQIVIVLLAHLIMCYLLYTGELNEKQNQMLEEMVSEKTRELKEANKKLETISSTDILTGLYNRRFMENYLHNLQEHKQNPFALFCIDLNMFKPINDTYGHEMGDRVLKEFGKKMRGLPKEYSSFRMGGDEFLIIMELTDASVEPEQAARDLQTLFHTPIHHETYTFHLSASIGISTYPKDSENIDELLQYADTAMYSVKHSEKRDNYLFFDDSLTHCMSLRQMISKKLLSADPNKDFILHYQPQVNADTGEVIGVEAFPHLSGRMESISPSDLIPVAEETGLMSQLGIWIASSALRQLQKWNEKYQKELSLTINLSPLQLIDMHYVNALKKIIQELQLSPSMLILDVSNDVIMGSDSSTKKTLEMMREHGFELSLNDFGGDNINLAYIQDCGFQGLKLSRTLISQDPDNQKAAELLHTILSIAKHMHIAVTAVGIETIDQSRRMRELGITRMQGYLFSKPLRAEELEKTFLRKNSI